MGRSIDGAASGSVIFTAPGRRLRFELDDAADDALLSPDLLGPGGVQRFLLQPGNQVLLRDRQFAADADGADGVHEIDGLTQVLEQKRTLSPI